MTRPFAPVLAAIAALFLTAQTSAPAPTPPATTSRDCPDTKADTQRFLAGRAIAVSAPKGVLSLVPVADQASRERGLMCVVRVPHHKGMIFAFPGPDRLQGFWMKNTLVALDMVFVSGDGTVTSIAANVPPTPDGTPDQQVGTRQGEGRFVIELGGGDAARAGIVTGTKLKLPTLSAQP